MQPALHGDEAGAIGGDGGGGGGFAGGVFGAVFVAGEVAAGVVFEAVAGFLQAEDRGERLFDVAATEQEFAAVVAAQPQPEGGGGGGDVDARPR